MCQRKNTEFVKDVLSVRGRGKQPVEVFLVDPLWEECNDFEELAGTGESWRRSGERISLLSVGEAMSLWDLEGEMS